MRNSMKILTRKGIFNTLGVIVCYIIFATSNGTAGQKILWSCDFSGFSLCGAVNVTSQTAFQFGSGETPSEGTGPSGDHTLERLRLQQKYPPNSQYIYLEASWARQEDRAILRLPWVPIVEEACLTFYYHMFSGNGWEQGHLRVTISRDSVPVWFVSGNKGPSWNQGQLTLPANTINIQFIAARGAGIQSDIALDDMMITARSCPGTNVAPHPLPPLPTLEPPPTLTPSPLPPLNTITPPPVPQINPITQSPVPHMDPVTFSPAPQQNPSPSPAPPLTISPQNEPKTPPPPSATPASPAPLPPQQRPVTPSIPPELSPDNRPLPCDPSYQYCPTSTTATLAWKISPRQPSPTQDPNPIITKSSFDWNSDDHNGLGFIITQAAGCHWSEVEESGQPLLSSNYPRRWLTLFSPNGQGQSSVTSRQLKTTSGKGCLEYKAIFAGQAALTLYLRQEGVRTAYKVHSHVAHPQFLGTVRLPVHNFVLTDVGFYISFKGEVTDSSDFVTIDDITLYNNDC